MNPWWRRLARNRLIDAGAALIAALGIWRIVAVLPHQAGEFDFAHFYTWSDLLRHGGNPYTENAESLYRSHGFRFQEETPSATFTPALLRLFAPLTLLSPKTAFAAWVGVQCASLVAVLALTRVLLRDRLSKRGMFFVCAATLASAPLYFHFVSSQIQLSLTMLLLAALLWRRAGRENLACVAVTVAGLIKLFPFALLPWFVWGNRGTPGGRLVRAAISAGVLGLGVLATGLPLWRDFFHHSSPVLRDWAERHLFNYSVPSFVLHCGYALHHFQVNPVIVNRWWTIAVGTGLALIAVAYVWCLVARKEDEAQFSLLTCAMLAGMPTVWEHYFVLLIFPLAVAATRVAAHPTGLRVLLLAGILVAVNNLSTADLVFHDLAQWRVLFWNYTPVFGLLALGGFFAVELRRLPITESADTTGTGSNTPARR